MIRLVPLGGVALPLMDELAADLARRLRLGCRVEPAALEIANAFLPGREQYHSTVLLERLETRPRLPGDFLLGVIAEDLCVPILTFVFGEGQLGGACAVVSTYRLDETRYGLPSNAGLSQARLVKEALHELGHVFGLRHCPDWNCVMSSSHSVERIDLKSSEFCAVCRARLTPGLLP